MQFRTEYKAKQSKPLDPRHNICLIGSCFSENIGQKMTESGWNACINPCGVIYNPASIERLISLAIEDDKAKHRIIQESLTTRDGRWASWLFSGHFGGATKEEAEVSCLEALNRLKVAIETSMAIIITLGTAHVYYRAGEIVNNCHKYPEKEFSRQRLSVDKCKEILGKQIDILHTYNRNLRVIYTVSPVRHLRDGFEGNNCSKATLILALNEIIESGKEAEYFPAYEILMDDLRDYRFYADDLLHPSSQGIEYIWEKFKNTYLSQDDIDYLKVGLSKYKASQHKEIF